MKEVRKDIFVENLSTDDLEKVSGGYIFVNEDDLYEVIDNSGNVVATYDKYDECVKKCEELGFSAKKIDWEDLADLRGLE